MGLETLIEKLERIASAVPDYLPIWSTVRLKEQRKHSLDTLTGLPMISVYSKKLADAINDYLQQGKYFCMVVTDTAGMKYANTELGNLIGDELLKATAGVLGKVQLTRRDCLARVGGDEFGYLFTGTKESVNEKVESARKNVYESQKALNDRFHTSNEKLREDGRAGKDLFLGGMELCIGVGVVIPEDIPARHLQKTDKPLAKASMKELIRYLLKEVGDTRARNDKILQGIYEPDRHPEYNRDPKLVNDNVHSHK